MVLQADKAEDWVIATKKITAVRDFMCMSFVEVAIELKIQR
jgi:GDPmannose 4,6-dehydratase